MISSIEKNKTESMAEITTKNLTSIKKVVKEFSVIENVELEWSTQDD